MTAGGEDRLRGDLDRIAGDPELAKRLREDIVRLRGGAGGDQLAEMARDLLDGRIDLRAVAGSSAYAEPLSAAAEKYGEWLRSLDPEERERLMATAITSRRTWEDGRPQPYGSAERPS